MDFENAHAHLMGYGLSRYLYHRFGPQAYVTAPVSSSYLALFSQPSDSYIESGPFLPKGPVSPLEAISDGYAARPGLDPLEPFFTAKREFWAKSVEDILGQISEREQIKYDNMYKIDYESCQMKTRLFELDHWRRGFDPQVERTRVQIEREMSSLEREKRFEQVACWRDVTRLKTELREALLELTQEQRKDALLAGNGK